MDTITSPSLIDFHGDAPLQAVLVAIEPHGEKPLIIEYAGRTIQSGYHVTEVKAGSFVSLDCGGNPDRWEETILQVEDLPSEEGRDVMTAGKFGRILEEVGRKVDLHPDARLTFEVGMPDAPMQIFDANTLSIEADRIVLNLASRPAICKPRHRAAKLADSASCCGPAAKSGCCA
jgi:Family of unknown function (DUF6428)